MELKKKCARKQQWEMNRYAFVGGTIWFFIVSSPSFALSRNVQRTIY